MEREINKCNNKYRQLHNNFINAILISQINYSVLNFLGFNIKNQGAKLQASNLMWKSIGKINQGRETTARAL